MLKLLILTLLSMVIGFSIGVFATAVFVRRMVRVFKRTKRTDETDEFVYLLRIIANNTDGGGKENVRVLTSEEMRRRRRDEKNGKFTNKEPGKMAAEEYLSRNSVSRRQEEYKAHKKFENDWAEILIRLEGPRDNPK